MNYPASFGTEGTYTPDKLVRLGFPTKDKKGTLLSGQNDLLRGTVLGRVAVGSPTGAAVAGNTGNGTIGTISAGAGAKPGVYRIVAIEPGSDAGEFQVIDPDGIVLGVATAGVAFTGAVNFTIADGATDFAAGDSFTITFAAGSGKYKKAVATAVDGSNVVRGVLLEDADAGAGDVECMVRLRGGFNLEALIYDNSYSAAEIEAALELNPGIVVESIALGA